MANDWKTWLENSDLTGTSPFEVVDRTIRKVAPDGIESCERLLRGEQNEVYAVATTAGDDLIVRISRRPKSPFFGERWTIETLRSIGVPAPEVLLVEDIPGEPASSVCVQRRLPGAPLADLAETAGALSEEDRARYAIACGRLLRRIHSVATNGYGLLDGDGAGAEASWSEFLSMPAKHAERFALGAQKAGLDEAEFRGALGMLDDAGRAYGDVSPHLTHHDFLPKHVLVDHGEIVGVIDFEVARGGDPFYDFAMWDIYQSFVFPLEDLLRGYLDSEPPPADMRARLDIYRLHFALRILQYSLSGFDGFAPFAVSVVREILDAASA